jgi:protein SCO1/2
MSGSSAESFLGGWRFPALSLGLLAGSRAVLLAMLLWPAGGAVGAFAEEFRIWCYGWDPATGSFQWTWVLMTFVKPGILAVGLLLLWWGPLRDGLRLARRGVLRHAGVGVGLALLVSTGFAFFEPVQDTNELPFPAEELRLAHTPPAVDLIDHTGQPVSLEALRGQVVIVTALYAHCAHTCPQIVTQARGALAQLPEELQDDVVILGITLDPERDTPEVLATMAGAHGLEAPTWRFATGDAEKVGTLLDRFEVARSDKDEFGNIDHANLFIVIDRQGKLAYRFTLGDRQQRWLVSALRLLLSEPVV